MNNTSITLAIVAIFMAATLLVGAGTLAATQSAFAYSKNRGGGGGDENSRNGNTVTPQAGKQYGILSGFDNSFNQELQNLICTHPSSACLTEGSEGASPTTSGSTSSPSSSPSSSSAQQRLQGLKQDTSSHGSASSSCTVGSFSDLVQTMCIPLPMP